MGRDRQAEGGFVSFDFTSDALTQIEGEILDKEIARLNGSLSHAGC